MNRMRAGALFVVTSLGCWVAPAAAQDDLYGAGAASASASSGASSAAGADPARPPELEVSLEVGLGSSSEQQPFDSEVSWFGVATTLRGRFRLAERVEGRAAWSFPYGSVSVNTPLGDDSDSKLTAGNPFVGAWYLLPMKERLLRLGGGVAMPVASADTDVADAALQMAAATHGLYEAWLWMAETTSIVLGADYRGRAGGNLLASAGADLAVLVPSGGRSGDTEVFLQWRAGLAFVSGAAQFGLRLLSAWLPNSETFQLSVRPFFEYVFSEFFVRAALHLNLDEPHGFSFDEGIRKTWGLLLTAGYRR